MACSTYQLFFNGSGVLSAFYRSCGDYTPMTVSLTGAAGALYGTVNVSTYQNNVSATTLVVYTGSAPASGIGVLPGYVYNEPVRPWAQYVISNAVSALSAHGLPFAVS